MRSCSLRINRHRLPQGTTVTFKVNSDLVLTNVVVRDKKTGELVKGLTAKDFTITEDGKPQQHCQLRF